MGGLIAAESQGHSLEKGGQAKKGWMARMVGMFEHLLGVVGPVLLCVFAGFVLAKVNLPFDSKQISHLVLNVTTPALIISHLAEQHVAFSAFSQMMLAALIVLIPLICLGSVVVLALRLPLTVFLGTLVFSNTGNVGMPIVNLAFGDQGMAFAFAYIVPGSLAIMTIGMWLPMRRLSFGSLYRTPVLYAIAIGILCMVYQTPPPAPIQHALTIIGGATIPLMLLSLGFSIATLDLGDLRLGLVLAVAHYAVAFASALLTLYVVPLDGAGRSTFILEVMMPVGVTVYLFAQRFSSPEHARTIASAVLFSTLMSVAVVPLVLEYWV